MENETKKDNKSIKKCCQKMDKKKIIFISISAIVLILLGTLISKLSPNPNALGIEEAKIKAEIFINENLMMPGTKANITEIIKEYGLYKIMVDVGSGEIIESYISQDGKLFFPQSINIQEYEDLYGTPPTSTEVSNKQDRPYIELFVMSHCPYGIQMEKALLPVISLLDNYLDFELKFNSYIMHEKEEIDEQLNQYCIQKENPEKLIDYLNCFNKTSESDSCLTETGINKAQISTCAGNTDQEYKITESYNDKSTWLMETYPIFTIYQEDNDRYGVEGSPTLIINEELVDTTRDSQSLLNLVCSSFVNQPEECQTELSNVAPGYGFGE
jgi:hypothetical protein